MKTDLLCIMMVIACVSEGIRAYSTKYDHIDYDLLLENVRLLKFYYNCMVGAGKCTPEISAIKKILPEILKTKCQKCTQMQKKNIKKVVQYIQKHHPDMWEGAVKKFDPTRKLTKNMLTDPSFLGKA